MSMKVNSPGTDEEDIHDPEAVTATELEKARQAVVACSSPATLKNKSKLRILRAIFLERGLGAPGTLTKLQLAKAIIEVRGLVLDASIIASTQPHSISGP